MNTKINIFFDEYISPKKGKLDEAIENFETCNLKTMSGVKMGDKLKQSNAYKNFYPIKF